jgi:hypothetical protein
VGPAFASDQYKYQEFDFYIRPPEQVYRDCRSAAIVRYGDSSVVSSRGTGVAAHLEHQAMWAPHFATQFRLQAVRFPNTNGPTTYYGKALSFRDLSAVLSVGMVIAY